MKSENGKEIKQKQRFINIINIKRCESKGTKRHQGR
jgi:hypothetical protein